MKVLLSAPEGEAIDTIEAGRQMLKVTAMGTASIQEAGTISIGARYIGDHQSADTWFAPYFASGEEAIERALELMRTVVPEFRRIAWG